MFNRLLISATLISLLTAAVSAQGGPPQQKSDWQIDVGAAAIVGPQFLGTKDYRILPVPYIDIQYKDRFFLNVPQGLGAYVVNTRSGKWGYKLSGAIAPGFNGRDRTDIPGLPQIDIAIEARAVGEISYGKWSANLTLAQDLGTGHEGFYADLSTGYGDRVGQRGFARLSGSLRFADDQYMRSFYGVSAAESVASGLAAYDAGSGLESAGVQLLYAYQLSRRWRASIISEVRFTAGDARNSPITGEDVALNTITAITYRF